jgi:hypothetical protein
MLSECGICVFRQVKCTSTADSRRDAVWPRRGGGTTLEVNPEAHRVALDNITDYGLGRIVDARLASSMEFVPDRRYDMAVFDSETELRVHEFRRFLPWLRDGAVVIFHDTAPHHQAVIAGVRWSASICRRRAASGRRPFNRLNAPPLSAPPPASPTRCAASTASSTTSPRTPARSSVAWIDRSRAGSASA